jgi:hypothetical protein
VPIEPLPELGHYANVHKLRFSCNLDYELNARRYRELGLPVPPNDCEWRAYGISEHPTPHGYLPGVPDEVLAWRRANPDGGVRNPWNEESRRLLAAKGLYAGPIET